MSAAAVVGYKVYNRSRMFDAMKANVGAIIYCESSNCSYPYEVAVAIGLLFDK